jgi:hypothetical protein
MADLVSLAEVKAVLQITDTANDAALNFAISAASNAALRFMGWDPRLRTVTEYFDGNNRNFLALNQTPIRNISSLVVDATCQPLDPSQFYWDDYSVYLTCGAFWRASKNVQVTYTGGYDPLPAEIGLAVIQITTAMWTGIQADQNATGESYAGVMSQQFWGSGPGSIPPQAKSLLMPYQRFGKSV